MRVMRNLEANRVIKILTIEQTRQAEAEADRNGYSYNEMMKTAGQAVAEVALELIAGREQAQVMVLVGAGNNGGDGLAAAIELAHRRPDANIRLYLLRRRADALIAAAEETGSFLITHAEDDTDGRVLRHMAASSDLVIDALFGIGARLPVKDTAGKVLRGVRQALNERARARQANPLNDPTAGGQVRRPAHAYVLAVDAPSGLDCNTGRLDRETLKADVTVTFIAAKPGLLEYPGAGSVGRLVVAPLDMPPGIRALKDAPYHLMDNESVRNLLPERPYNAHKGTFGKALIVGGSANYAGAVALAAEGAYRSGAGLVTVASIAPVVHSVASQRPEVTLVPLEGATHITRASVMPLIQRLAGYPVMLVGPGLGFSQDTQGFMTGLLSARNLPALVIDADGLNLLRGVPDWWKRLPPRTVLTPHPGEMARLCGMSTDELAKLNRLELAVTKAREWNVTVVLKGAHTVIAQQNGQVAVSPFKTDALATAGTGDVLAGVIAGLMAQGLDGFRAAQAGVYAHGLSGVLAGEQTGSPRSVIAGDVARLLPQALSRIMNG